jgi:hypothetical protein
MAVAAPVFLESAAAAAAAVATMQPSAPGPAAPDCPICLDPIAPHDGRVRTPCQHTFHLACYLAWDQKSDACPVCRAVTHLPVPMPAPMPVPPPMRQAPPPPPPYGYDEGFGFDARQLDALAAPIRQSCTLCATLWMSAACAYVLMFACTGGVS